MCGGNKVVMQMYGPHSLNEDGTIMAFDEQMAIVSHYLHNQGYKYAKPYESKAEGLIEDIYNVHNKQIEKDAFQMFVSNILCSPICSLCRSYL